MPHLLTRVTSSVVLAGAIVATATACGSQDKPSPATTPTTERATLDFHPLVFQPSADGKASEAQLGDRTIVLLGPDNVQKPTAWEGPLRIENRHAATSCSAPLSLVTGASASAGTSYLIAQSYSGSLSYIHYIDVTSCQPAWATDTVFTEGVVALGDSIVVQPACECAAGGSGPCSCSAGRVLQLAADRAPAEVIARSRALTKRVLGVEFTGRAKVRDPKTPRATLVSEGS